MLRLALRISLLIAMLFALFAQAAPSASPAPAVSQEKVPQQKDAYVLTGDKLQKAIRISNIRIAAHFGGVVLDLLAFWLILRLGIVAAIRGMAERASGNRWVQAMVFVPLTMLVLTLISLPLSMYMHAVNVSYGLSVQHWGGWLWDVCKSYLVSCVLMYFPAMGLIWLMRKRETTWWFWMWCISVPFVVFMIFVSPLVLDPIMNKFEPLEPSQPRLVGKLEQVVKRGGLEIGPERMFLMKASLKTTQLNAYVTGLGASKRVVVWDTSLQKATDDQILFIFGHEMGHYVLHHIPKTVVLISALLLVMFYAGHRFLKWALRHEAAEWKLRGMADWSSVVVLALAFSIFSFFMEPAINTYSRHNEHEADVYGMEAIHGIVSNPQAAAQSSFQLLGETSLVDPHPNKMVEFWTSSHPSIPDRAAWSAAYDPWVAGRHPKYFALDTSAGK